jgi:hypothetical protein
MVRWRRVEQSKPGDHQTVSLARQRRRQNRVTLRIARQLLGETDQVLTLQRRTPAFHFHVGGQMIAHFRVIGNLSFNTINKSGL